MLVFKSHEWTDVKWFAYNCCTWFCSWLFWSSQFDMINMDLKYFIEFRFFQYILISGAQIKHSIFQRFYYMLSVYQFQFQKWWQFLWWWLCMMAWIQKWCWWWQWWLDTMTWWQSCFQTWRRCIKLCGGVGGESINTIITIIEINPPQ